MRYFVTRLAMLTMVSMLTPWAAAASAEPASPSPAGSVDCANASKDLMDVKMPEMTSTGSVDHDYLVKANASAQMMMKMSHIEMSCGKQKPALKAAQMAASRDEEIDRAVATALRIGI